MAGGGDTEDTRWDDAVKYRLTYGPVHFGAMYKFADGSGGCYSATAHQAGLPPPARRKSRITLPMDSTSAVNTTSSPPTSSTSITTRRSAY